MIQMTCSGHCQLPFSSFLFALSCPTKTQPAFLCVIKWVGKQTKIRSRRDSIHPSTTLSVLLGGVGQTCNESRPALHLCCAVVYFGLTMRCNRLHLRKGAEPTSAPCWLLVRLRWATSAEVQLISEMSAVTHPSE